MSLSKIPRILFEDQEILVCHKPSGVPAQTNRIGTPDLVSILKNHLRKESRSPYLALIHRLDQPVEGLMVFAKTPRSAKELSRQLTTSGFGKYYLAVAVGVPSEAEADLTDYLVKDAAQIPLTSAPKIHHRQKLQNFIIRYLQPERLLTAVPVPCLKFIWIPAGIIRSVFKWHIWDIR